jgi:hypothetical protein
MAFLPEVRQLECIDLLSDHCREIECSQRITAIVSVLVRLCGSIASSSVQPAYITELARRKKVTLSQLIDRLRNILGKEKASIMN